MHEKIRSVKSLVLFLVLLTMTVPAFSEQEVPACPYAKVPLQRVGGYQLKIYETFAYEKDLQKRTDLQMKDAVRCVAAVVSDSGAKTVVARYWVLSWLAITGTDVNGEAQSAALNVVLAYLYSGREKQAWHALSIMWPITDQARMKELIMKTRTKGILSQIGPIHGSSTHQVDPDSER